MLHQWWFRFRAPHHSAKLPSGNAMLAGPFRELRAGCQRPQRGRQPLDGRRLLPEVGAAPWMATFSSSFSSHHFITSPCRSPGAQELPCTTRSRNRPSSHVAGSSSRFLSLPAEMTPVAAVLAVVAAGRPPPDPTPQALPTRRPATHPVQRRTRHRAEVPTAWPPATRAATAWRRAVARSPRRVEPAPRVSRPRSVWRSATASPRTASRNAPSMETQPGTPTPRAWSATVRWRRGSAGRVF